MIDYTLAKKLKEAGFPQDLHEIEHGGWIGDNYAEDGADKVMSPTLSELIEACGEKFHDLTRVNNSWLACALTSTITHDMYGEGTTPEEAVARLWLALNKKI